MADDRHRRFTRIERPRTGGDGPDRGPATGPRFGALEERAPAPEGQAEAGASGHTDRFRPAPERPLEVEARGGDAQPFVRCCRCETDCSRYAARCTTCGAPLDTDEQRAFNERLWEERRAQAEAETAGRLEREAALERARLEASEARRTLAETLARQVGEAERRRLDREGFGEPTFGPPGGLGGADWSGDGSPGGGLLTPGLPLGFRLLGLLPPGWRVVGGVAALGLAAGLYLLVPAAGLVAGLVLLSLFVPGGVWRWRRRSWW